MDLDAINCQQKALKHDTGTSFIGQMMLIVVSWKLRGLDAFGRKRLFIETVYWLSKPTASILLKIIPRRRNINMSPRCVSMEH